MGHVFRETTGAVDVGCAVDEGGDGIAERGFCKILLVTGIEECGRDHFAGARRDVAMECETVDVLFKVGR